MIGKECIEMAKKKAQKKGKMKDLKPKKDPKGGALGSKPKPGCGSQTRGNYQCR